MGHTDLIAIGDCGLPIPDTVVADMKVEKIVLAEEIKTQNPKVLGEIEALFAGQAIEVEFVAHVEQKHFQPIFKVQAVDTTAAGDTFTGYFMAGLCEGLPIPQVLKMSAKASSIAVSRPGAVPSIPWRAEVETALAE